MNKLKKPTAQQFANWLGHDLETVNAAISADMGHEEIAEVISEIYFKHGSLKEALMACAEDLAKGLNESSKIKTKLMENLSDYGGKWYEKFTDLKDLHLYPQGFIDWLNEEDTWAEHYTNKYKLNTLYGLFYYWLKER